MFSGSVLFQVRCLCGSKSTQVTYEVSTSFSSWRKIPHFEFERWHRSPRHGLTQFHDGWKWSELAYSSIEFLRVVNRLIQSNQPQQFWRFLRSLNYLATPIGRSPITYATRYSSGVLNSTGSAKFFLQLWELKQS